MEWRNNQDIWIALASHLSSPLNHIIEQQGVWPPKIKQPDRPIRPKWPKNWPCSLMADLHLPVCQSFVSSDRSSYSDDLLVYIQQATFWDFHPVLWCNWCYKCHSKSKSLKQYQCNSNVPMFLFSNVSLFQCSNVQMFKLSNVQIFKCSNVQMFNLQMIKC